VKGEPELPRSQASRLLVGVGLLLLVLCAIVAIRRQDALASALAVLGLGAIILGVLMPRLEGPVELGPSGLKLQLVKQIAEAAGYSKEDLDEAIAGALTGRVVAPSTEESSPVRRASSENAVEEIADAISDSTSSPANNDADLARALLQRWNRTGATEDLQDAVDHARAALEDTPADSSARAPLLLLLAYASLTRFETTGDQHLLDEATVAARQALATTVQDSPEYEGAIRLLASASQRKYDLTGALSDQDEAIWLLRQLEEGRRRRGGSADSR
jgi:hypothetical protein